MSGFSQTPTLPTRRYRRAVPEAVILSAVRTPVGRYGGGLSGVRPDDLAAVAVAAAVERAGVPAAEIEDVWLGCANQAGEDNRNVARFAALLAGLPDSVGGVTVNRLCASGLAAVAGACHAVIAGDGDLFVAGGVESMSRAPLVTPKPEVAFARGDRTSARHDPRLALHEPALRRALLDRLDGRDRRERRGALVGLACGSGCVRARVAAPLGRRRRGRSLRRRARGRRRARAGRAPAPRDDGREARVAEAGLRRRGHGHCGERERDQRRRGRSRRRERRPRARARRRAARHLPWLGGRGRRPRRDGNRAGAGRAEASRSRRDRCGRARPGRAQRGVRLAVARGDQRARRSTRRR